MRALVGLFYAFTRCDHGAGPIYHRVGVATRYAFKRAQIVVRLAGWFKARELREGPTLEQSGRYS